MPVLLEEWAFAVKVMGGSLAQTMLRCNTNAGGGLPVSWKTRACGKCLMGYFASRADSGGAAGYDASLHRSTAVAVPEEKCMPMSGQSLLVVLLVGLVAGWLAAKIVTGGGLGIIGDLVVGILGAFIAAWLLPKLGVRLGTGIVRQIIDATLGAVILLALVRLIRRL
jgi:uncharacterized membrane protein YeaQ/YmgE (transglycosylase-associated protein family)